MSGFSANKLMCDVCSGPCFHECDKDDPDFISHEFATIEAYWGFYSNKDLFHDRTYVCEKCYDEIMEFIVTKMHGSPKRFVYNPWPQQNNKTIFEFIDEQKHQFKLDKDRPQYWPEKQEHNDEEDICM